MQVASYRIQVAGYTTVETNLRNLQIRLIRDSEFLLAYAGQWRVLFDFQVFLESGVWSLKFGFWSLALAWSLAVNNR